MHRIDQFDHSSASVLASTQRVQKDVTTSVHILVVGCRRVVGRLLSNSVLRVSGTPDDDDDDERTINNRRRKCEFRRPDRLDRVMRVAQLSCCLLIALLSVHSQNEKDQVFTRQSSRSAVDDDSDNDRSSDDDEEVTQEMHTTGRNASQMPRLWVLVDCQIGLLVYA